MLDLTKIGKSVVVKYGKDETYTINFVTDERIRQLADRKNIGMESILDPNRDSDDNKDEKDEKVDPKDTIVISVMNAVFNTDFVTSVVCEACTDWTGIYEGKKPFPCTDKNKKMLFETFGNRALFVYRKCRDEKLFMGGRLEDDLKN